MQNVAIVGCGQISRAHLAALAAVPTARVVALCDADRDRARAVAALAPGATIHTSLAEAVAAHDVDVVHVLTPPASHAALAIEAAGAGCHVLVEKPMALDVDEADRMIGAARAAGTLLVPSHNYLFKPSVRRARALIAAGAIGEVVAVNSYYGVAGEQASYGAGAGRSHWAWSLPGGVFTNYLPHLLYLQLDLLGRDAEVVGASQGGSPDDPTELNVLLRNGAGVVGSMAISMRTKPYMKYVEICGTNGVVHADLVREIAYVHHERRLPGMVAKVVHSGELVSQVTSATLRTTAQVAIGRMKRMPELRVLVAALYASLETGAPPPTDCADGRRVAALLEDIGARVARPAPAPPAPVHLPARPRTPAEARYRDLRPAGEVVVTGASGFLGGRLAESLVRGGARPVVLVRDPRRLPAGLADHVRVVTGDLRDPAAVREAVQGADLVFHCAAVTTNKAPAPTHVEINVEGTRLVVASARDAGVQRVVHCSSVIVYGVAPGADPVREDTPVDRTAGRWDHYLRTKADAEHVARSAADDLELVVLRLGILYGPGRALDPAAAAVGRFQILMGGGRNLLPYTHVDDAVDALLLAAVVDRAANQTYNVVGNVTSRVRDVACAAGSSTAIGVPRPLLLAGASYLERQAAARGSDVPPKLSTFVVRSATRDVRYSTTKARTELEWTPAMDLASSVPEPASR